jgi:hypothetical protein
LVTFVVLKICLDLFSHRREHRKMAEKPRERASARGAGGPAPLDLDLHRWERVRHWKGELPSGGWSGRGGEFEGDSVSVPYTIEPIATPWRLRAENLGEGELNVIVWPAGARQRPDREGLPAPLRGYVGEVNLLTLKGPGGAVSDVFQPIGRGFMLRFLVFDNVAGDVVVERAVPIATGQS